MVVDMIFDSVCRCFGAPESQPHSASNSASRNKQPTDSKRRAVNFDAQSVAKAKLASRPRKRKGLSRTPDGIFRSRDFEARDKPAPPTTNFTKAFPFANALCFATPINEEDEPNELIKTESDCNTLNTCEDTITSTVAFERKYAHLVESRPPMPLFNQFKVDVQETDELRRIVATDSHNSLKMIRYMDPTEATTTGKVVMDEEDEDSDDEHSTERVDDDDDVPPAIKIDSSASSSDSYRR